MVQEAQHDGNGEGRKGFSAHLPEALFDLDFPGHVMRRIKSVSVSLPCVTGPYTGVSCTLTLLRSSVRHANTLLGGKYARQEGDPRFTDSLGAVESIVTSRGQEDSGLFEANLRDERYLPFEGAGVISEWRIELPAAFRQFDYDTISDVILHLRYTAREGGGLLRQRATSELQTAVNDIAGSEGRQGLAQVWSLRHEFPTEWHRFLNPPADAEGDQSITLDRDGQGAVGEQERGDRAFSQGPGPRSRSADLVQLGEARKKRLRSRLAASDRLRLSEPTLVESLV